MDKPNDVPDRLSPEWNDYVLTLFAPEELIDGHPNAAGLRRIAELLIGPIIFSSPTTVFPVQGDRTGRATVVYEVHFKTPEGIVKYGDVADVWDGNTDALFMGFAVATASTRAEGRALRKALKLRVCAAEELSKVNTAKAVNEDGSIKITKEQIDYINKNCKLLNIDVVAFINSGEKQYRSVYDVLRETAAKMLKELNKMKNGEAVPPDLIGYKQDWEKQ